MTTKTTDPYDAHTHLVFALCDARNRVDSLRLDVIKRVDEIDKMVSDALKLYAARKP